jgi:hypothetical protein
MLFTVALVVLAVVTTSRALKKICEIIKLWGNAVSDSPDATAAKEWLSTVFAVLV